MFYISRILVVFCLLILAGNCVKKTEPVTVPVKDPRADISDQYTASAGKLAKEAQYRSSNFLLKKAISIYSDIKYWEKAIQCYIQLSENFQQLEDYESARLELNSALDLTRNRLGYKHLELAKSFQKIGYKYLSSGQYDRAIEMYDKALFIQLEILGKNHPEVAKTYNSIALAYWNKGESQIAHENYNKSFSIKLRQFQGIDFNVKKKYKLIDGDETGQKGFSRARDYFNRSLAVYLDTYGRNDSLFAVIYENIGILYAFEGNYDRALEYLRRSFATRLNIYGDDSPELAASYHNIGICLRLKGDDTDALHFLTTALEIKEKNLGKHHPDTADIHYQLGKIYFKENDYEKALTSFQKALIAIAPDFSSNNIFRNPKSDRVFAKDRLLKILAAKADTLKMQYYHDLSLMKELRFSYQTYLEVISLIDEMRRGYKSESYKLFFGEKSHDFYDQAIQTALLLYDMDGDPEYKEAAFTISEKSKASVLAESLAESRARRFAGIPDHLLERERDLKSELNLYDTLLEKEYQEKENADPQKLKSLESRFFDLRTQYNDLIDYFEENYQKYYDLKYNPQPVTAQDIMKALNRRTAFIEYFVGRNTMNIFVLTNEELEVVSLPVDEQFHRTIDALTLSIKKIVEQDFMILSRQLYLKLIDPIRQVIGDKKKLVVIPHGRLFYIPFEALIASNCRSGDVSNADYLIKHYAFSYHYSAWLWLHTADGMEENRQKSFIGFAPVFADEIGEAKVSSQSRDIVIEGVRFPRLPGTEMEVRAIIELFKSKHRQAKGHFHKDASEENFKALEMKNYSIIHVATHSLKIENNPKLSGLIFAQPNDPDQREDGILYSGETYNLNLNAELIVLSSCESGIGKLVKGEGMIALNRGFLYSGIQNTIFSLWKVDDKTTSRLMIELYRNILLDEDYATALQQAKLKLIRNRFSAFPRYWSSFILVGQ